MLRYMRLLFFMIVFSLCSVAFAQDDPLKVELQSNKKEYICSEPILLKTTIINNSSVRAFIGQNSQYRWGDRSFTIHIAYNNENFIDIYSFDSLKGKGERGIGRIRFAPLELYGNGPHKDNYAILNEMSPNQQIERMDLIIIRQPGEYQIKVVFNNRNKEDPFNGIKIRESKPIKFRVYPASNKSDSIIQIGDPNFIANIGLSIFYAFHIGIPAGNIGEKEFQKIADEIIHNHKDSVFREYMIYANTMIQGWNATSSLHPLPEKYKQEAIKFDEEYPDSWLLPQVYSRLTETFVSEKNKEKAKEYKQKALKLAPNDIRITRLRQMDLDKWLPKSNDPNANKQ